MYATVAFIATVIAVVIGQPPPPACCLANTFTATLSDLQTINGQNVVVMAVTLDFPGQREAAISSVFDTVTRQTTTYGRNVFDFAAGKQYYIPESDTTSCTVSTLNWSNPQRCVPNDAQYLGSNHLGLPGALDYDAWRYPFGPGSNATLTMVFARQGCVPVLEGVAGVLDSPVDKQFLFSGYNPDNIDPAVFTLPAACNQ
ncbi:uncharacterized protein [Littorina saxatilis]|uniref:uncharacterized protein n=1 Tax=Littorina saxatilis TaxID=31220 RepID=UPI0038B600F9